MLHNTSSQAQALRLKLLQRSSSWHKMQLLDEMSETDCALALSGLRLCYPYAHADELRWHLADLLLAENLDSDEPGVDNLDIET